MLYATNVIITINNNNDEKNLTLNPSYQREFEYQRQNRSKKNGSHHLLLPITVEPTSSHHITVDNISDTTPL